MEPTTSPVMLFLAQLAAPLSDLLILAVTAGIAAFAKWALEHASSSKAARVGAIVAEAAQSVVHELDVTLKPKLTKALEDGVLTEAEKVELKAAAMDLLKTKLPPVLLGQATKLFGALTDTYLAGQIEKAVVAKNAAQAIASNPPSP